MPICVTSPGTANVCETRVRVAVMLSVWTSVNWDVHPAAIKLSALWSVPLPVAMRLCSAPLVGEQLAAALA